MKQIDQIFALLDMIDRPAFCVKAGRILRCNPAAMHYLLPEGTPVNSLMTTGLQEYSEFKGGDLLLTLNLAGVPRDVCITRMGAIDLFSVEPENSGKEMHSFALTAQTLRQPLASISLAAEALSQNHAPESRAHLARLNKGMYQLMRLTENMADAYSFSLSESHPTELRNVAALVKEILDSFGYPLEKAGIRMETVIPTEPIDTLVNRRMLERAIGNMLSNAIKYAPIGSTLKVSLSRKGNIVYLTVADQGSSIMAASGGRLFSQHHREPGLEDGLKGLGLGLHLVRCVASAHGGAVLLQNDENGNRITMTLAVRQGANSFVRNAPVFWADPVTYDSCLMELADVLPPEAFLSNE